MRYVSCLRHFVEAKINVLIVSRCREIWWSLTARICKTGLRASGIVMILRRNEYVVSDVISVNGNGLNSHVP
jgi:hypothetical protein